MKLVRFDADRVGALVGDSHDHVIDVTEALSHHDPGLQANYWVRMCQDLGYLAGDIQSLVEIGAPTIPLGDVTLLAPVLNPSKIVAAAANYTKHVEEMRPPGTDLTRIDHKGFFDVFLKAPSSVVGPGSRVKLPNVDGEIHYEGELGFIIGRGGRDIPESEALDHVLGYTIVLDVTVRGEGDRSRRKSHDGFTPIGPCVVTADEVPDWELLHIELRRNGEVRQSVRAGEMLHPIPEIVSRASSIMTLLPGDVFATGSPPGVGKVEPGDKVSVEVDPIGVLAVGFE